MSSKRYHESETEDNDMTNIIQKEIQQLKQDIQRTEKKILSTEKRRKLSSKPAFTLTSEDSDLESSDDRAKMAEFYSSPLVERIVPCRKLTTDVVTPPAKRKILREFEQSHLGYSWASPSEVMTKRVIENNFVVPPGPIGKEMDDYLNMDFGATSPISLDYGLVSPKKKVWSSPPQRIGRAQNREWSSPHRIIDHPNPESSPGNWISVRESHFTVQRPPSSISDIGARNAFNLHDYVEPSIRPASQATFTIPDKVPSPENILREEIKTIRKSTVLAEYGPYNSPQKQEVPCSNDRECNLLPSNDKVKRFVGKDGHVVKVSTLKDFDLAVSAKSQDKNNELHVETGNSNQGKNAVSPPKKKVVKKSIITDDVDKKLGRNLSHKSPKASAKVKEGMEVEKKKSSENINENNIKESGPEKLPEEPAKKDEDKENDLEKINLDTNKMMKDLENFLKDDKVIDEKVEVIPKESAKGDKKSGIGLEGQGKGSGTNSKPKALVKGKPPPAKPPQPTKNVEEENLMPIEKRKRPGNLKSVQEYIKQQKQKRVDQLKTEREKKSAEMEARKKKLEELRIKSLQLAAASKKKRSDQVHTSTIKIIETEEEMSMSMSLGLKQVKPKMSYNETVSNMKKKPTAPSQKLEPEPEKPEENKKDEKVEIEINEPEKIEVVKPEETLTKPEELKLEVLKAPDINLKEDLNATLKKLAESLKNKMDKQIKSRATSIASKSTRDPLSQKPSQESLKPVEFIENNKEVVSIDIDAIQTLKEEFKQISKNFQTLHEIILGNPPTIPEKLLKLEPAISDRKNSGWLKTAIPHPHPYNVITAVKNKWQLQERTASTPTGQPEKISITSRESSIYAEPVKYDDDFEPSSKQGDTTTEENYYSMKDNSGSDFSSSILDSDKESGNSKFNKKPVLKSPETVKTENSIKESIQSSDITSVSKKSKLSSYKENLVLVPPDLKLVTSKLNNSNSSKNSNDIGYKPMLIEDLNNKVNKESKSESTIAEIIDNLTESDRSQKIVKRTNEQPRNAQGSFFNPEAFHLQFQAELTLLETFQQSLSHFLEMERMKTITEVNRVVNEKAINTEKVIEKGDRAVQTSFIDLKSDESIKTVINSETESIKTEIQTEAVSSSVPEEIEKSPKVKKSSEKIELSDSNNGISFQMLERMMKDEELRSEHQLALIRLREKTLNEKVKAELTFLEMKKKALKEIGSDEEQNISAIKKKQRGILLKYQSEKEEIERLKKMHKIASEERKIMIKQQKQIQKMQVNTKDILIKLKKREKSPQKRMPVKAKSLKSYDSQSDISEDIPESISESIITETPLSSVDESIRQSIDSDFEISSKQISEAEDEILKRNTKTIEEKISKGADKLNKCKKALGEHEKKLLQRRHSVEELLKWKKRLEEEENRLKELEKQAMNVALNTKHRLTKSLRDVKISMRDTSTSPFHFQEPSVSESSHSITEAIEVKKSSSISEVIESKIEEAEVTKTEESVPEKIQSSASEDIPEEFSKRSLNNSNSRTIEYNSESFESPSSSETPKSHPPLTRSKSFEHRSSAKGVTIKQALSPRIQGSRRRYSSGSDESINLSYTETASEQSDVESRIAALHEQLRRRKLEAERLRREQKKAHRERLKAKEQSLIKQIQAYDSYIQKKKQELEQEYEYSSQKIVKPLIKQPKVAEKAGIKRQDSTTNLEGEVRIGLHPNITLRKKEPEVLVPFEKLSAPDKESDNEISERIKDASETTNSISEQIESKIEEEEVESVIETESRDISETGKSTSISESIPKPEGTSDHSQSESEEQSVSNVSVKTTLHSPEKPDAEKSDTIEKSVEEEIEQISVKEPISEEKQESPEDKEAYSTDSFESDFDNEKSGKSESVQESISEAKISEEIPEEDEEKSEIIGEIEKTVEDKRPSEEVVDAITDSILNNLLLESVRLYDEKKKEEKSSKKNERIERLTDALANEIISDAINDMMKIYNRKVEKVVEEPISPDKITSEVRRRIHEIMSLTPTGGMREQGKPQDLMKTTYDVSPVSTTPTEETKGAEHEEFLSSLSMVINKTEEPDRRKFEKEIHVDISSNELPTQQSDVDAFGQEWFDEDFGLSRTRKEAEELRLQQLQIEQEIQQLQAQQQQEQVPYYYLREIPNKPPPPYTPPGKAPTEKPSTEADITAIMTQAVRILTTEINLGKEISTVEPHPDFFGLDDSESVKCYKVFLFDLAKHIISEVLNSEKDEEKLPWMRTNERLSKYKCKRIDRTFESLNEYVIKKVLILFGFRQKVGKESLIVRWSRKKRDHVDELLVSESQEEESQWTRYDKDQVTVKNEVTTAILDTLIDDTVQVLVNIFNKKKAAV